MTIYKLNGVRVDKLPETPATDAFPTPRVSRMEPYISPITDRVISSWTERDREMKQHDCFDPRDLAKGHEYSPGRAAQMRAKKNG